MKSLSVSSLPLLSDAPAPVHPTWWAKIRMFLLGQMALQGVTAITGIAVLHWMPSVSYAQVSMAFAFQGTIGMLTDLGVSNCIIALTGENAHKPEVVGRYIAAAAALRLRMFWIMAAVAIVAFPLVTYNQPWGFATKAFLLATVLSTILVQNWTMYQSALIINGRLDQSYSIQVWGNTFRLAVSFLLYLSHAMYGTVMAALGAIFAGGVAYSYKHFGGKLIVLPEHSDKETQREILRYLAPLVPGIVFTAFQSQITLFLASVFGNTSDIAEMSALGRLSQLFVLLGAFNGVIIEPFFARLPVEKLKFRYTQLLLAAIVFSCALVGLVALFPQPVLWLIGKKYAHLAPEIVWIVAGSATMYLAGVLWTINAARKWLFGWYTGMYIAVTLLAQIVSLSYLHLSRLHDIVIFSLITSVAAVVAHFCANIYGLTRPPVAETER